MFSLFTWASGDVVFEDWETNISEALAFESPTAELILEATRAIEDEEILGRLLGTQESIFACTQTTELPLFQMRLSPAESSVLTFARQREQFQRWDLPRVAGELPLMRALNTLASVGLLEIREKVALPEPEPPPVQEPPPMQEPLPEPEPTPSLAQVVPATSEPATSEPAAPMSQAAPAPWRPDPVPDADIPASDAPAEWSPDPVPADTFASDATAEWSPDPVPADTFASDAPAEWSPDPVPDADMPASDPTAPWSPDPVQFPHAAASPMPDPPAPDPDVEKLLDAYENKRAEETGRHRATSLNPLPSPNPAPTPTAPDPPPTHDPHVDEPDFPTMPEAPSPLGFEPEPPQVSEPAPPPVEIDEKPLPKTSLRPRSRVRKPAAPKVPLSERLGALLPKGKGRVITASVAVGLAAIVAIWFVWSGARDTEPDPVVSASTNEPPPAPEVTSDFLEADLFYRASVAFGEEDYEEAKIELEAVLELKPDFTAAQLLLEKVRLELEPPEAAPAPKPKPKRTPKPTARKPPPPRPVDPTGPNLAEIFAEAQLAFEQGDIETAEAKLEELRVLDPRYAQAAKLVGELAHGRWMAKLPLSYSGKHGHIFGGYQGVLTLNADGIGFTSDSHSWSWPFAELDRNDPQEEIQVRAPRSNPARRLVEVLEPRE